MLNNIVGVVSFGQQFKPTDIAGCKLWLDAADTATISVSGTAVTQWNDKSGNSYNFAQSTAGNRPLSGTRTINSKNVIDFDGTDDRLVSTVAKSTWTFMHYNDSTMFYVVAPDASQDGAILGNSIGTGAERGYLNSLQASGSLLQLSTYNGTAGASGIVSAVVSSSTYNTSAMYVTVKSSPQAATASRAFVSKNNGSFEGTNLYANAASASAPLNDMAVGSTIYSPTSVWYNPLNGGLGEIIVYDTILSAGNISKVQAYLSGKWGI
jgi:hypothetical protein